MASERTDGSLSVPTTLVAGTFTGSVQTHKQNKYTLSRPRMHADTPSLTPRGAHMYHTTSTVQCRWFRGDWDTFHRRRPRRQEMASVGRPAQQSYSVEGARRSSVPPCFYHSKHGPAARKNDSKSSFPANALLTSPSRRVVAIEAARSGSISHPVYSSSVTVGATVRLVAGPHH